MTRFIFLFLLMAALITLALAINKKSSVPRALFFNKNLPNECAYVITKQKDKNEQEIAKRLYEQAFSLGFKKDQGQQADLISKCVSYVLNGSDRWPIDATWLAK